MNFERREVWRKLFGALADDWLSIREASMIYEAKEGDEAKDYTLNRAVQILFRELKDCQLLDEQFVEKKKQSTSRKGKPRSYTSKCLRYRLNIVKLFETQLGEESVQLSTDEVKTLERILVNPAIDTVLRRDNRSLEDFLTKLVFIFIVAKRLHPVYQEVEIPELTIPEPPLPEIFDQFTKKEIDDFQLAVQRIAREEKMIVDLADKILEASIPITFTSKEYYRLVAGGIVEPFAKATVDTYRELIHTPTLYRFKRTIHGIFVKHFAKIKKEIKRAQVSS
jgi:hypothetical protein